MVGRGLAMWRQRLRTQRVFQETYFVRGLPDVIFALEKGRGVVEKRMY